MYPHSGRGGPYRWDREEEYIRSRYLNQQHLRAPASGSFSSRATSSDRYYTPHQVEPPVDYRERDLEDRRSTENEEDNASFANSMEKRKSFRKLLSRFADKTAMQGVGYINSAKSWYSKAIWVSLLLVAMGWMFFHLFYLITQFTDLPVQTKISLGFNNLQFPAVTLCNMNVVKFSELPTTSVAFQSLVALTQPSRFKPEDRIPGGRKKRFVSEFDDLGNLTDYGDYYDDPSFRDDAFKDAQKDNLYEVENTFKNLYLAMPRGVRVRAGHQIQDMLLSCSFNGFKCFPVNFTLVNTAEYGNCFTIESGNFITKNPGPKTGLTLIFYTQNDEFLEGISQGYGMRLQIHEPGTFPMPDEEGIFLSSSFESHIGLRLTDITRITPPHRECNDGIEFKKVNKMQYSRSVCRIFCEQGQSLSQCGCYSHDYKEFFFFSNNTNQNKWCKTQQEIRCLATVMKEFGMQKRTCSCLNPCKEKKYSLFPSSRQWPTEAYSTVLMQSLCEQFPAKCQRIVNLKTDPRSLGLNFVKVTVYYEDLNYEEFVEEPEIATAQFASDVGGAVGLWIGLSVLAIFEVVQFFIELCAYGVHVWRYKQRKSKQIKKRKQRQNGYALRGEKDFANEKRYQESWNSYRHY